MPNIMKNIDLRKKIFKVYSDNLKFVVERYKIQLGAETGSGIKEINVPLYICPLCSNGFTKELVEQDYDNPLTIEDLPPKSVGGNPKILTCKRCNNKSGYSQDKLIIETLRTESFLKKVPASNINSIIKINKGKGFRAITEIGEKGEIRFVLKTKNNPILRNQVKDLQKEWEGSTVNFNFSSPNIKKFEKSLIRIGLLLSFYYLGNRILFEENYHKIRKFVTDPKSDKLPHNGVIILPDNAKINEGLHILIEPTKYRAYFVVFKIKYKTLTKIIGFPFPGPGTSGWENYSNFSEMTEKSDVELTNITSSEYVRNKERVDAYDYLYENF